jgi:hypothetical protein
MRHLLKEVTACSRANSLWRKMRQAVRGAFCRFVWHALEATLQWSPLGHSLAYRSDTDMPHLALFVRATSVSGASVARRQLLARESRSDRRASASRDMVGHSETGIYPTTASLRSDRRPAVNLI